MVLTIAFLTGLLTFLKDIRAQIIYTFKLLLKVLLKVLINI